MKYLVTTPAGEIEVAVDGDRVTVDGQKIAAHLSRLPGAPLAHLLLGHRSITLALEPGARGEWAVGRLGVRWNVEVVDERTRHIRGLAPAGPVHGTPGAVRAPMPGLVVRVVAVAGQAVAAGQGLVVLEAMKMENEIRAPVAGRVTSVRVAEGQAVEKGEVLIELGDLT
jgi:pyruvate carboxylase subunit B